jgi:hypothetical protein
LGGGHQKYLASLQTADRGGLLLQALQQSLGFKGAEGFTAFECADQNGHGQAWLGMGAKAGSAKS